MYAVGVRRFDGSAEARAAVLAQALGLDPQQARTRAAGAAPRFVAMYPQGSDAEQAAVALRAAGMDAVVLHEEAIEAALERCLVRRFALDRGALGVGLAEGRELTLASGDIDLVVRGVNLVREVGSKIVRERKLSMGRAFVTGGLSVSRETYKKQKTVDEHREAFIHLHGPNVPALVFRESELSYDGFGPRREATRTGNFLMLAREIRTRFPAAFHDEGLLLRPNQAQVLGPIPVDEHVPLAAVLLAMTLRPAPSGG